MKRQEQIKQQAKLLCNTVSPEEYFILGAQWADRHPAGWISVEDELPKCYKPYIDCLIGETTDLLESDKCLVLLANGNYTIATLNQDFDEETGAPTKEPYWFDEMKPSEGDCIDGQVTHWMPLPAPPKKGGGR